MENQETRISPCSSSSSLNSSISHDSLNLNSDPLWFARLQEILLMHRPFDFCVLLVVTELIFGFIYFLNLGIFATIALLGLLSYMLFIHYCHPNPIFEKIFFPPLKKPIDQTQPNRIRSYEEFSNFVASVHHGLQHYFGHKHLTGLKRVVFGVGSFIFALLLKRVVPFWVNFLLVHCILFLPMAILRPWPTKDVPNEEPGTEEISTQANSQTPSDQTQAVQPNPAESHPSANENANQTANANPNANNDINNNSENNNSNLNSNSNEIEDANSNIQNSPVTVRDIQLEDSIDTPADKGNAPQRSFSTPSAKNAADYNPNAFPTPPSTPLMNEMHLSQSTPIVNAPPSPNEPGQKAKKPKFLSKTPSKPASASSTESKSAAKSAAAPKQKLKFHFKGKGKKDGE